MQLNRSGAPQDTSVRDRRKQDEPVKLRSAALARLIEEVRVGEEAKLDAYNRTYHRHNR